MRMKIWLRRPPLIVANGMYLLAIGGQVLIGVIVALLAAWTRGAAQVPYEGLVFLSELVILVPPTIYAARRQGVSLSMRLNPPSPRAMLYALISAPVAVYFLNGLSILWVLLIEALGGAAGPSNLPPITDKGRLLSMIAALGVLPGICEEVLFRGAILGSWERRGTRYALIVSSVLFCLMHTSFTGLPVQLIMGLTLGYVAIAADSLYVSMLYHTAYNAITMIFVYVASSQPEAEAATVAVRSTYEALGGVQGVLSVVFSLIMSGFLFAGSFVLFNRERRRGGRSFERIATPDRAKMGWRELAVLLVGLITVGLLFLGDVALVFRWLPS